VFAAVRGTRSRCDESIPSLSKSSYRQHLLSKPQSGSTRRRGSLGESTTNNPQFLRKDSKLNFEWRLAIYHIHLRRTA
jgi:hypothetical protein